MTYGSDINAWANGREESHPGLRPRDRNAMCDKEETENENRMNGRISTKSKGRHRRIYRLWNCTMVASKDVKSWLNGRP